MINDIKIRPTEYLITVPSKRNTVIRDYIMNSNLFKMYYTDINIYDNEVMINILSDKFDSDNCDIMITLICNFETKEITYTNDQNNISDEFRIELSNLMNTILMFGDLDTNDLNIKINIDVINEYIKDVDTDNPYHTRELAMNIILANNIYLTKADYTFISKLSEVIKILIEG